MSNMKYLDFPFVLQKFFYYDNECGIDEVAHETGIPAPTLYKRVAGESITPPEEIRKLTKATKSPIFLDFIAEETPFMVVPRPKTEENKPINEEVLDVAGQVGLAIHKFNEAYTDKKISRQEKEDLKREFRKVQREVEEILQALEK